MVTPIRLVVFDWAGTIIDFGSRAPLEAFVRVFEHNGVEVTPAEVRQPMGLHKKDHLERLLQMPTVRVRWQSTHHREPNGDDLERMYHDLVPAQLATVRQYDRLIPGVLECVARLRERGIRVAGTTGYFQEAADICLATAREQALELDTSICGDEVPKGRPAPWMIYRVMERLGIYPPSAVLKIGDTVVDIEEGLNAGVHSVGVCASSNEMGCSLEEYQALSLNERNQRLAEVAKRLQSAGAEAVLETLDELPALVDRLSGSSQQ